ncbi:LysM peptidoglycan-binding domain-containing protein [Mycobacterium sp. 852002-51057_SCH5723018]|uniref:LysM peptidoglycan-binding domain-containing protein n=1 Tax=Mycobacterium sp. 852002-51057_SCH5723018 TaxID=1834094 RepID=UPI000B336BBF|nr:LysM peptidoglycan-binding domain-containing protein [Mycobacterium sp. 852002-51057_SCH5723018]
MSDHAEHTFGAGASHGAFHEAHDDHSHFGSHDPHDSHDFVPGMPYAQPVGPGFEHGDPAQAVTYWFAQHGSDCVPASVTQVLSEAVGHRVPESEVLQRMTTLGMDLPTSTQGVPFADAERLLDSFGISSHEEHHVTLARLEGYLDQGRSVILGVDANPIWHYQDGESQGPAPHAVMITSIDESTGTVTLSDTGNPHGNEEHVPLNVFMYAWGEQGNQLVVTDSAIDHHPGPALMPLTLHPFPPDLPTHSVPPLANPEIPDGLARPGQSYAVLAGDTLWDIAERAYGNGADYTVIAAANGITDPDHIAAGVVLTIPERTE